MLQSRASKSLQRKQLRADEKARLLDYEDYS